MDINDYLKQMSLLQDLFTDFSNDDLKKIEIVYYASDITIIRRHSFSNYVYLIVSGICGMFKELENGENFCYYKISNCDVIGLSEIIGGESVRNANIHTLTNVVAFKIHKNDMKEWMIKYPDFYNKVMHNVIDRLHKTLTNHVECKKYTAHANVVSYLIYSYDLYKKSYPDNHRGDVKINETRNLISDFIGISIRTTNSTIEKLKDKNLVTIKHGKIYINYEQYENLVQYKEELLM